VEARTHRVPGLGDLPVIGSLFRSVRYQAGDTELVVLVTASLVEPMNVASRPTIPGTLHVSPNDWELYGMGMIEGKGPAKLSETDAKALQASGLHRLRGPGAWATAETPAAASRSTLTAEPSEAAPAKDEPVAVNDAPAGTVATELKQVEQE
jgi:pilus assembly protein CpaC